MTCPATASADGAHFECVRRPHPRSPEHRTAVGTTWTTCAHGVQVGGAACDRCGQPWMYDCEAPGCEYTLSRPDTLLCSMHQEFADDHDSGLHDAYPEPLCPGCVDVDWGRYFVDQAEGPTNPYRRHIYRLDDYDALCGGRQLRWRYGNGPPAQLYHLTLAIDLGDETICLNCRSLYATGKWPATGFRARSTELETP